MVELKPPLIIPITADRGSTAVTEENVLAESELAFPFPGSQIFRLLKIFSVRRPYDSAEEKAWVKTYIVDYYKAMAELNRSDPKKPQYTVATAGPMENVIVTCDWTLNPKTLFSCHTDTVHWKGGMQEVLWDSGIFLAYKQDNEALGADDGTGVWLMMQMLDAGVPGTYVFHRGEERSCIGSGWMKDNRQTWLKTFDRAIAFDRRDTTHVITRQRGNDCCSDVFAEALALRLNQAASALGFEFDYKPDPTGVYTDTANYIAHIPECTNISIGYENAHGGEEQQDVEHAVKLAEVLCRLDWATLPTVREAKAPYQYSYSSKYNQASSYTPPDGEFHLPWASKFSYGTRREKKRHETAKRALRDVQTVVDNPPDTVAELDILSKDDRMIFLRCFPEQADALVNELLMMRRDFIKYVSLHKPSTSTAPSQSSTPVVSFPGGAKETPPAEDPSDMSRFWDW